MIDKDVERLDREIFDVLLAHQMMTLPYSHMQVGCSCGKRIFLDGRQKPGNTHHHHVAEEIGERLKELFKPKRRRPVAPLDVSNQKEK